MRRLVSSAVSALETPLFTPIDSFSSIEPGRQVSPVENILDSEVLNGVLEFEKEVAEVNVVVDAFVNVLSGRYRTRTEYDEVLDTVRRYATEVLEVGQTVARIAFWEAKRKVGSLALLTVEC